jgi:hypothetical protein
MSLFKKYYNLFESISNENMIINGKFITAFSEKNLIIKKYEQRNGSHKPRGLWFSKGQRWIDFLLDYDYIDEEGKQKIQKGKLFYVENVIKFEINNKKFYYINNEKQLIEFIEKYKDKDIPSDVPKEFIPLYLRDKKNEFVDSFKWEELSNDYDGIYIKDVSDREYSLINSWDVPSGCLWNLQGIKQEKTVTISDYMKKYYNKDPLMKKE